MFRSVCKARVTSCGFLVPSLSVNAVVRVGCLLSVWCLGVAHFATRTTRAVHSGTVMNTTGA